MTIAFSVVVTVFLLTNINNKQWGAILVQKDNISIHDESIKSLEREIADIKSVISEESGAKSLDVSGSIKTLEMSFLVLEEKNKEVMSILRDDPETLATIREINVKYDRILSDLDKIDNKVIRAEDKIYSGFSSDKTLLWTLVVAIIAMFLQQIFSKRKESK